MMRSSSIGVAIAMAIALASSTAFAAPSRGGAGPGGGGASPGGGGSLGGGGAAEIDTVAGARLRSDGKDDRAWQIEGNLEYHRLLRQNDLEGAAVNKNVNVVFLYGRWNFGPSDRVTVRLGAYERFVADDGETGLRFDDFVAYYTHFFALPDAWTIAASAQVSAPTSFASQKESIVTVPRLTLRVSKPVDRFTFDLRTYGEAFVVRYDTAQGGNVNPRADWVQNLGVSYRVPVLEKLTVGVDLYNEYIWYYPAVDGGQSGKPGAASASYFGGQPTTQEYGGEIYARYSLPEFSDVQSELTASYAQGDPSLGFTSALHDGVRHVYPAFWRLTSEVYFTYAARY